ncbi:MAG: DUF2726 domain-containing protein [Steroidobacteraceae bacterium]
MLSLVLMTVAIAAALALFTALLNTLRPRARGFGPRRATFCSRPLMTDNELEFFGRLEEALPDCKVFSQVAMSGILDVTLPSSHPAYWRARSAFDRKRMDYVVCTSGGKRLITVVELDDRTHDSKRQQDAARDAMLADAGIRTVRFPSHPRPSAREIRAAVLGWRAA